MHKARKRFGQNFLIDNHIISQIIHSLQLKESDQLLEIGPGQGALTEHLLEKCLYLNLIELDRDLIPILRVKFHQFKNKFQLYNTDALQFDIKEIKRALLAFAIAELFLLGVLLFRSLHRLQNFVRLLPKFRCLYGLRVVKVQVCLLPKLSELLQPLLAHKDHHQLALTL